MELEKECFHLHSETNYSCISSAVVPAWLNVASIVFKSLLCFKRFFYEYIWRTWDEEEEDDFDYFVRCVEPRLRL